VLPELAGGALPQALGVQLDLVVNDVERLGQVGDLLLHPGLVFAQDLQAFGLVAVTLQDQL
jgi:hypothetical protein